MLPTSDGRLIDCKIEISEVINLKIRYEDKINCEYLAERFVSAVTDNEGHMNVMFVK
jgi:hypothetical protein